MPEVRLGGEGLELAILPVELLLVDEKTEPFFKAQVTIGRGVQLFPQSLPPCRGAS